ncbi:MAG: hypothetical protein M0000_13070 [Actinomycetota bacterium]|nr:hypothetical protein [Actinomycetota bacterium]
MTDAFYEDLKKLEFDHRPSGGLGIGMSMKVKRDGPTPIHYYREKRLETEVVCSSCTLRYSVYGVFAFCPDCGQHNSLQILAKNLDMVEKMVDLAAGIERELRDKVTENALENCVSAFDGFGRELCRLYARKARSGTKPEEVSFQNLDVARTRLLALFGVDLSAKVSVDDWRGATKSFQKRHLVAHKLGVVDRSYLAKTGDSGAVLGRKILIGADEVKRLAKPIRTLASGMLANLQELGESE